MLEQWRDVVGYEGRYQVSNQGTVRSLARSYMDGRVHQWLVHRLVALAFLPQPGGVVEVDHKDGDPLNNRVSNLEWVTHKENLHRAIALGLWNSKDNQRV